VRYFLRSSRLATVLVLNAGAATAWAHEGHGGSSVHTHAFEGVLGVVGVLLVAGWWLWSRNKR
jgi:hypothetical protein